MTDIAAEAGMGLTALYRYFPNKPSLIRELAVRLLEQDRSGLLQQLMDLDITANELLKLASSSYVQLHRDEPYRLSLRMAIQADSTLLAIDLEDSQNNAQLLAGRISQRTSVPDITTLERFLLMHMTLLNSTIQLMFQLDDEKEAEAVFEAFLTMAQRQLDTVL